MGVIHPKIIHDTINYGKRDYRAYLRTEVVQLRSRLNDPKTSKGKRKFIASEIRRLMFRVDKKWKMSEFGDIIQLDRPNVNGWKDR